jgi:hypothetical protein
MPSNDPGASTEAAGKNLALPLSEFQEPQFQGSDHRLGTVGNPQFADYVLLVRYHFIAKGYGEGGLQSWRSVRP